MKTTCRFLVSLSVASAGCFAPESSTPNEMKVSALAASEPDIPLRDVPAARAFQGLSDRSQQGMLADIVLGLYELEPVPSRTDVEKHWQPNMPPGATVQDSSGDPQGPILSARTAEGHDLTFNTRSGAERWTNRSLFHMAAGVAPAAVLPEASYVKRARAHLLSKLPDAMRKLPAFAYKVRHYRNVAGEYGNPANYSETTSQIAVAFNTTLDDLPVIGPGSKLSVHMLPDGTPVSHEQTVRGVVRRIVPISGVSIMSPAQAREKAESNLRRRGVDLGHYKLSRSEFGYYRRGPRSVQKVVAPYYAFFYDPLVEGWKSTEEHFPATTDASALDLIAQDEAAKTARRTTMAAASRAPDVRKGVLP